MISVYQILLRLSGNPANCSGSAAPLTSGGHSKENCCCNHPSDLSEKYLTGATCGKFCEDDCSDKKLKERALNAVKDDPIGAMMDVGTHGADFLLNTADKGFDFLLFITDYGIYILGFIFLIFLMYFLMGLGKGLKASASVAGEQAMKFGANQGTTAAAAKKAAAGKVRLGKKKWRKKYRLILYD